MYRMDLQSDKLQAPSNVALSFKLSISTKATSWQGCLPYFNVYAHKPHSQIQKRRKGGGREGVHISQANNYNYVVKATQYSCRHKAMIQKKSRFVFLLLLLTAKACCGFTGMRGAFIHKFSFHMYLCWPASANFSFTHCFTALQGTLL